MKPWLRNGALVGALLLLTGCFWAGNWEDDAQNWKRATGENPPKDITVIHSVYWRTPHFTCEDGWTFQIRATADYKKKLFAHYKLRHPGPEDMWKIRSMKGDRPAWFLPRPLDSYEVWVLADVPGANFALFVDRADGDIFITDSG